MFEDSYLDSFMEGHIGNWSGDEDRMFDEQDRYCPEEAEMYSDEEIDEYDSDPEYDNYDDPNDGYNGIERHIYSDL